MPLDIPYTFIAGTKAKASEVNADFDAITSFVDELETTSAELELSITQLQNSKADKNGDTTQIFREADAVADYDGVNLRTFKNLTENSKGEVYGFKLSKQSNTSVNATPGACWDSSFNYMIKSDTSLVASQANLSVNATYYIYVVMDTTTKECSLVIDLSNSSPSGYSCYRQLGKIITDGNGYVSYVETYGDYDTKKTYVSLNLGVNGTLSLANNLPNDGHIYLVWVYNSISGTGSGANTTVATDIFPTTTFNQLDGDAKRMSRSVGLTVVPVGAGRTITTNRACTLVGAIRA